MSISAKSKQNWKIFFGVHHGHMVGCLMKKAKTRNSHATVPLKCYVNFFVLQAPRLASCVTDTKKSCATSPTLGIFSAATENNSGCTDH
jgi:hypothetical protein